MRRKDRLTGQQEALSLLETGIYGILSTVGAEGVPYGVPLSFVTINNSIYFHCAQQGHKLDNLRHQSQVSFCVVGNNQPVYKPGNFTTTYESTIVFGKAREICDPDEKYDILHQLCKKYLPDFIEYADSDITKSVARTGVWAIDIESVSGKRNG